MEEGEDQLISAGRSKGNKEKKIDYPEVEEEFSYDNFEKYILNGKDNIKELNLIIKNCELCNFKVRFNVWRILLGIFPLDSDDDQKKQILQQQRNIYTENFEKFKPKAQNVPKESKVINPLANKNSPNSPWSGFFEDNELKNDIKKDVERTYQDKEFFLNLRIKQLLTNILFVWSKLNPTISYRQGMNEIAASLIMIYFQESMFIKNQKPGQNQSQRSIEMAKALNDIEFSEADIFGVFNKIMELGHQEMFQHNNEEKKKKTEYNIYSKKSSPILQRVSQIQDIELKIVDIELFKHLKLLNVEFQVFLLRWIRCMFTREYHIQDSYKLWDNIFYDYFEFPDTTKNFYLINCISLAMISYVRHQVLQKEDSSDCLHRFLKYPPVESIKNILDIAYQFRGTLFFQFANFLNKQLERLKNYNPEKDKEEESKKEKKDFIPQYLLYQNKEEDWADRIDLQGTSPDINEKKQNTPFLFQPEYTEKPIQDKKSDSSQNQQSANTSEYKEQKKERKLIFQDNDNQLSDSKQQNQDTFIQPKTQNDNQLKFKQQQQQLNNKTPDKIINQANNKSSSNPSNSMEINQNLNYSFSVTKNDLDSISKRLNSALSSLNELTKEYPYQQLLHAINEIEQAEREVQKQMNQNRSSAYAKNNANSAPKEKPILFGTQTQPSAMENIPQNSELQQTKGGFVIFKSHQVKNL